MGQSLDPMTQKQSKDELLYQQAIAGNVDTVKALCSEGAILEWIDRDGKTPLIVACMDSGLYNVAKVLIEMGANVNAYRPGRHAGTPLHHAVKRGLEQTVKLLLSSGANALVRNDDCQTALDVARIKGNINIVRTIESHICYFTGWLREFYGPGFLRAFAPQFLSRKIWAAVIPQGSSNPMTPKKLELVIYPSSQDVQPRTVIALWNAEIEEPNFNRPDPEVTIFDQSTKTQYKLASANEGDKQQLHCLYDACSGVPQVTPPPMYGNPPTTVPVVGSAEAVGLAMAIGGSIQSTTEDNPLHPNTHQSSEVINANGWEDLVRGDSHNRWGVAVAPTHSEARSSGWMGEAPKENYNGCAVPNMGPSGSQGHVQTRYDIPPVSETSGGNTASVPSAPSAPPIPDEELDAGLIHHPSFDFSLLDLSVPAIELGASVTSDVNEGGSSSSCIICWEAPVEGACIPCGHMAGCMTCLSEIKAKKGVCPVCRSNINQVTRLYAV
ncbi:putative E3 ubiquitin-protein ligase XBAT35 isoform X1 [Populus alba]|uniref:Auxin-regulated protein-like protein n=2 Tax=Populus TaxID=3689 RepID=A0A4U5Q0N9_POPAL|nr:putative E3 ubiquitin-protein ligase XBAT35 [Populus alba]KAJ6998156.1 E3 ubiquitin-protein ligase XBAT35 [Populus alba x Populus x berolinensis]KAJ6998168.1 E3 ubiquitin-protein ligase XBAT35 [Populus alba x Populus x berolinensis]TKS03393.1 auxin-regulated protein-like protein [Populus alba]